jgi:hypothetical protein
VWPCAGSDRDLCDGRGRVGCGYSDVSDGGQDGAFHTLRDSRDSVCNVGSPGRSAVRRVAAPHDPPGAIEVTPNYGRLAATRLPQGHVMAVTGSTTHSYAPGSEGLWRERVSAAEQEYHRARDEADRALEHCGCDATSAQIEALFQARACESAALDEFMRLLRMFHEFLVSSTPPSS